MTTRREVLDARILVVDDQDLNVALLEDILGEAGFTDVISTTDPRRAVAIVADASPDIVLLDLMMPHLDGFAVMDRLAEILPEDDRPPVLVLTGDVTPETKRRALAAGAQDFVTKPFDPSEVVLRSRNLILMRLMAIDMRDQNRTLEGRVRERTAELEAAYERERAGAEKLRELDRMKDAILTAVSHDVRTPLTVILGLSSTMSTKLDKIEPGQLRELTERVAAAARRLGDLLGAILDVDRIRRGMLEPRRRVVDVAALADRVLATAPVDTSRHTVTRDLRPASAAVDPSQVARIVENLIANAVRYTPDATTIGVCVRRQEEGVLIAVDDEGPGVPDDLKAVLFSPFARADDSDHSPGIGLGLTVVAGFATLHGGRAWVQDRPGGGASFRVFLPAGAPETGRPVQAEVALGG